MNATTTLRTGGLIAASLALTALVSACSGSSGSWESSYDVGYDDGFAQDDEYYAGYVDSWITEGAAPIFYRGHEIPFLDDGSYDAGFYDGLFDAYNDGYFVAYRYAFIIGFSEGYDSAFAADYLDFLANDVHFEFRHGGFSDGYNDGFSEGRVFGAFDYEAFLPFDWLDAFLDWQDGTDLYFEEVDVGTGAFGPVILYEWGFNPFDILGRSESRGSIDSYITMRAGKTRQDEGSRGNERPLTDELRQELEVAPETSDRTGQSLRLESTWLERIESVQSAGTARNAESKTTTSTRAPSPRAN
jgi:hypothetical protein